MKTITPYLICLLLMPCSAAMAQQQTLLMMDDFEPDQPGTIFWLNFPLTGQPDAGNNKWIVNDDYDGQGIYADTPPQDSTLGNLGQIGNPNGRYLHIRDMTGVPLNATYNPANPSDRFARVSTSICTYGFTEIKFSFWWSCVGSPGDYGEVYYSVDGGTNWNLATNTEGFTKYYNMDKWKYQIIKLPTFINQDNLTFAFKWHNDGIDIGDEIPFSIDDVMIVAEWDSDNNTTEIDATYFDPLVLCQEHLGTTIFSFLISDTLCPGAYEIEFSDTNGAFANTTTFCCMNPADDYGVPYDVGTFSYLMPPLPSTMPIGGCYTFRINRIDPPYITGNAYTGCITLIDCTDSIAIAQPPAVTQDPLYDSLNPGNMPGLPPDQQPVCVYSVIDVKFYTYGAYNPGNNYSLELSDENGDFANSQVIGGPSPDFATYDPAIHPPPESPGSISGQIPVVPEGCNYYIRVVSDNPVVNGRPWGPFCIKECDILSNNAIDVTVCLSDSDSVCVTIDVDINSFDSSFFYYPGNQFIVEVLSPGDPPAYPPPMTIIDQGTLGVSIDTVSGTLDLCFPPISQYMALGFKPGMYYMRIISTDGVDTFNLLGSVIRMTVNGILGYPIDFDLIDPGGFPVDTVCKNLDAVCIRMNNHNPPLPGVLYTVSFNYAGYPYGVFVWDPNQIPFPTVCLTLGSFNKYGWYTVTVQESFGGDEICAGPVTPPDSFYLQGPPQVNFPTGEVCVGDTTILTANYDMTTYYEWTLNDPNGIAQVLYYSNTEIALIWVGSGTMCLDIMAINKCGESSDIKCIAVLPKSNVTLYRDTTICEGDQFYLHAVNSFKPDNLFTWYTNGLMDTSVYVPFAGKDSMLVSPIEVTTYSVVADNGCPDADTVMVKVVKKAVVTSQSGEICLGDSTQLSASVPGGASYQWSPSTGLSSDTISNPIAKPDVTTDYVVTIVYDSVCPALTDTVVLTVNQAVVNAGGDTTIFKGDGVIISAGGGVEYVWSPADGLSNPFVASPVASPDATTTYYVTVTDENGCVDIDSVTIEVLSYEFGPEVPDAFTPDGSGLDANNKLYVFDVLGNKGDALESIVFKIFNRWGELIFEADSKDEIVYPYGGWDGANMNNGKPMEVGVYVWLLEAQTVKGIKIGPVSGNVSLLK